MQRRTAVVVIAASLLGVGGAGVYARYGFRIRPLATRPTTFLTVSGEKLIGFFSGLQPEDRFDLRKIRNFGLKNSPGCSTEKPTLLSRLSALFSPRSVHAQNECSQTECNATHAVNTTY